MRDLGPLAELGRGVLGGPIASRCLLQRGGEAFPLAAQIGDLLLAGALALAQLLAVLLGRRQPRFELRATRFAGPHLRRALAESLLQGGQPLRQLGSRPLGLLEILDRALTRLGGGRELFLGARQLDGDLATALHLSSALVAEQVDLRAEIAQGDLVKRGLRLVAIALAAHLCDAALGFSRGCRGVRGAAQRFDLRLELADPRRQHGAVAHPLIAGRRCDGRRERVRGPSGHLGRRPQRRADHLGHVA